MRKRVTVFLSVFVLSGLIFTGCVNQGSAPQAEKETTEAPAQADTQAAESTEKEMLSDDEIRDIVFDDAPVSIIDAQDMRQEQNLNTGEVVYSFKSKDGEYVYTINMYTGEIIDKKQPDKITTSKSNAETFDEDAVFEYLRTYCPVDYALVDDLKVALDEERNIYEVTFSTADGPFYYSFDVEKGELLEERIPEHITDKTWQSQTDDPYGEAIDKCIAYSGFKNQEVGDIDINEMGEGDGKKIQVSFKVKGEDYTFIYTPSTGKVEKN